MLALEAESAEAIPTFSSDDVLSERFLIVRFIGRGGMGEVYEARDTRLRRDVAIKVLPQSFANDADRLRRFEQEARAVAALNHPNILALYDIGVHRDTHYLVVELLKGATLRTLIGGDPIPTSKVVDYSLQIARGMAAAHDKGIVHRDLKPANIFVGNDGQIKILDFGLAKPDSGQMASSHRGVVDTWTTAGMVLGTVSYMSPEQVRGQRADHRSDIFSFGTLLYEMLAGSPVFKGESSVEIMNAVLKDEPTELIGSTRFSPEMKRIVWRCLQKRPEERFQSSNDLAFALESLTGRSIPPWKRTPASIVHERYSVYHTIDEINS